MFTNQVVLVAVHSTSRICVRYIYLFIFAKKIRKFVLEEGKGLNHKIFVKIVCYHKIRKYFRKSFTLSKNHQSTKELM